MVQPQSLTRFDGADVVALMDADEARACVNEINHHMNSARARLLDLYERRGWEALGYASWRECVTAEFEDSQRTLYRQLEAAQIESRIVTSDKIGELPYKTIKPLSGLTPIEQPAVWQRAVETAPNGKVTAAHVNQTVREWRHDDGDVFTDPQAEQYEAIQEERAAPRINAGLFTSATPEWYTPAHIIERVIKVFGQIDLDPCSNSSDPMQANVPALAYYTQADDGLAQSWKTDPQGYTRVYMNPPYGDEVAAWVDRLVQAYESEEIGEAIALLPARTDTSWFQPLKDYVLCFVKGRLRFSGSENSAPFPSVVAYLGADADLFVEMFSEIGFCMRAV